MFTVIWEFHVLPELRSEFERIYGCDGKWARLFCCDVAYGGTGLLKGREDEQRYLTLDVWDSEKAYREFVEKHRAEYEALDAVCEGLTQSEKRFGSFEGVERSA